MKTNYSNSSNKSEGIYLIKNKFVGALLIFFVSFSVIKSTINIFRNNMVDDVATIIFDNNNKKEQEVRKLVNTKDSSDVVYCQVLNLDEVTIGSYNSSF